MKKSNKNGFILAETIAISVVIMTSLVIIYTQFRIVSNSYFKTFNYNSVNNLYLTNNVKEFIKTQSIDELKKMLDNADYVDLTSCSYFTEYIYCEALFDSIGANKVIFTKEDLSSLRNNLPSNFSEKLKQFINYINYENNNNYRLIVEFSDETYASLLVK